jgi:hypothetical protein
MVKNATYSMGKRQVKNETQNARRRKCHGKVY